jgi:hypothetical protein
MSAEQMDNKGNERDNQQQMDRAACHMKSGPGQKPDHSQKKEENQKNEIADDSHVCLPDAKNE